jgi:hypothetical protein
MKLNERTINKSERDCNSDINPKRYSKFRNSYKIRLTHSSLCWFLNIRISERRSICAIKNISRIRLIYLSKNLFSFSYIQSRYSNIFIFYNVSSPFSLSIFIKYYMQLFRRKRRFIRKKKDITKIIHRSAYLYRNIYKYNRACIRPAVLIRLGLAPHLPLTKTPADL